MKLAQTEFKDVSSLHVVPDNEELVITQGGLYSPFPIPAYKILIAAKEHIAKDVLLCLISHMGKGNSKVFPSYDTLVSETGRSRASMATAIRTLVEFGFIKKHQNKEGIRKRNVYYLQGACWHHKKMNAIAVAHSPIRGRCGCGAAVREGEMGFGVDSYHHFSCGAVVTLLPDFAARKKNLLR